MSISLDGMKPERKPSEHSSWFIAQFFSHRFASCKVIDDPVDESGESESLLSRMPIVCAVAVQNQFSGMIEGSAISYLLILLTFKDFPPTRRTRGLPEEDN